MNKRQAKKNRRGNKEKIRALLTVDLTNVTDGAHIDMYIPNKYEVPEGHSGGYIKCTLQDRCIGNNGTKYDYIASIKNGWSKHITLTPWVTDESAKPYYVIRPEGEK